MKLNVSLLSLIALVAICPIARAQNSAATPDNNQAAPAAPTPAPASDAPAVAPATTAPAQAAPATDPAPAASAPVLAAAPVAQAAPPLLAADNPPATNAAVAPVSAAPAAADASANAPAAHDPNAVIPLIVMDEVPLIDAIKNLARQAGLNYMLDPKISYGTPGPDGVIKPQPAISLRWENLTADQALSAVLKTYNLTIIDDPKTRIALITVKDPTAPDPLVTKIIQLKYASASNMVVNTSSILNDKRSKVIADNRTSQLVVVATDREMSGIDELVARLDTPTKQVLIEARIVETSKNPTTTKGIDWSGTLQAQHVTFGNGNTTGTYTTSSGKTSASASGGLPAAGTVPAVNPPVGSLSPPFVAPGPIPASSGSSSGNTAGSLLNSVVGNGGFSLNTAKGLFPSTAFLNADGASAVLSFLNNNFDASVLSTPRAVTLDNEEAVLQVTTAQPIFLTTAGTQGSPGGSQVIYTNLGTILHVTPRISANNTISLKVIPEVSDVAGVVTKTVGGLVNQADVYDIRRIETHVLIPSGNTLVMGGLVGDNRTKGNIKVPVLGDIPFLGAAFRQESKTQNKKNLIIFVTPTIVQSEDFQPTESSFLKTKVPDLRAADFGAWDSGKPQDWSKLMHSKKDKAAAEDGNGDIPTTN